jgi:Ca2+-binding EF-hand superfamily protein
MRMTATLILAAGLTLFGSPAGAGDQVTTHDPRAAFAEADTSRDGTVDREEFHVRIVEVFYHADRNKDGFLDAEELKALAFPEDFTADDKDRDGRVSMREFLRVRFRDFDPADTDQDGVLSLDEVVAVYEGKRRR